MQIVPYQAPCGARIESIQLNDGTLKSEDRSALIDALHQYHVVAIPGAALDDDALERFSLSLGPFGDDPFIAPIANRNHIIAVCRRADETAPIFAENWHTDWSFQKTPPAATCLQARIIPPVGGQTCFANQQLAAAELPSALRATLTGRNAIHSAKLPYAPEGVYGDVDRSSDRSMDIRADQSAYAVQAHPILSAHPATGIERIFGCVGYIVGIEGLPDDEALDILLELMAYQSDDRFVYTHHWEPEMLLIWDNRSVLHKATGGYEGYERLLHRTTVSYFEA
jgi:taurine dioxygenase